MESANSRIKDLGQWNQSSDKAKYEHMNRLQTRGIGNHHSRNNRNTQQYCSRKPPPPPPSVCARCAATGHHRNHECRRSRDKTCSKCKKLGYFAKMCKSKSVTTDHKPQTPEIQQQSGTFMLHNHKRATTLII